MDILNVVLVAVVASFISTGIVVFILKSFFQNSVNLHCERKVLDSTQTQRSFNKVTDVFLDQRIAIYPEIAELINKLKNSLHQGAEADNAFEWCLDYPEMCACLTERLNTWRFYIPKDVFDKLYDFKHICQNVLMVIDVCTRSENLTDQNAYEQNIERHRTGIMEAIRLHNEIQRMISDKVNLYSARTH